MHLILTLLPTLQKTPNSRLVLQSSDLHRMAPSSTKFASLDEINQDIGASYLYNRSKLAQVLFIRALVRRMEQRKLGFESTEQVWANASHPGAVSTDQQKQAEDAYGVAATVLTAVTRPLMKDPIDQGCRPALFAATAHEIISEKIQGQYVSISFHSYLLLFFFSCDRPLFTSPSITFLSNPREKILSC